MSRYLSHLTIPFCLLFILVSTPTLALSKADLHAWKWQKEIVVGKGFHRGYALVKVDHAIYNHAKSDLSDVRIISDDGTEVPYQLVTGANGESNEIKDAKIFNLSHIPGKYTMFMLDLGLKPALHNKLTIHTDNANFIRDVEIAASDYSDEWHILRSQGKIFRFAGDRSWEDTTVSYPESNMRYLRVTVKDNGEGRLNITSAEVMREKVRSAKKEVWSNKIIDRKENKSQQVTELTIDLGYKGIPIEIARIDASDRNFNRNIEVYGSNNQKQWVLLGQGTVYAYSLPNLKQSDCYLTFSPNQWRYMKFKIYNMSNKPLNVNAIVTEGFSRYLMFEGEQGKGYTLYYGNNAAEAPSYDLERFADLIDKDSLSVLKAGRETQNPSFRLPPKAWLESNGWLLWVILSVMIFVLGGIIIKSIRKI